MLYLTTITALAFVVLINFATLFIGQSGENGFEYIAKMNVDTFNEAFQIMEPITKSSRK